MTWLFQSIQLGSISVPVWLLASITGLAGAYGLIRRLYRSDKAARTVVFDLIFNTFFIFFLVWKLSPAVFRFSQVLEQPSALLFLPGGTAGSLAGAGGAVIYLVIKFLRIRPVEQRVVRGLVFAVLVFTAVFFLTGSVAGLALGTSLGQAPDFQLTGLDGNSYRLSDLAGKQVVLNFWASWCGPCRAEIPELVEFYESLADDGAVLLGINQTVSEAGAGAVSQFAERQNMSFPILLDTANKVHGLYGIRGIPTTVIVDPTGMITARRMGAVTSAWLKAALR